MVRFDRASRDRARLAWTASVVLAATVAGCSSSGGSPAASAGASASPPPSAELYNPTTGSWGAACGLVTPRSATTATLLLDGRVLVVGGNCEASDSVCAVAEI
jgi:hypothetical protein